SLSDGIPAYDPVAILNATQSVASAADAIEINTDVYGAEVEGEVAVSLADMPMTFVPPQAISDQGAADFVRRLIDSSTSIVGGVPTMAYAALGPSVRDLGLATDAGTIGGI